MSGSLISQLTNGYGVRALARCHQVGESGRCCRHWSTSTFEGRSGHDTHNTDTLTGRATRHGRCCFCSTRISHHVREANGYICARLRPDASRCHITIHVGQGVCYRPRHALLALQLGNQRGHRFWGAWGHRRRTGEPGLWLLTSKS